MITCVFYEKLPFIRRYLRRFIMDSTCPQGGGCCNAMVKLDDIDPELTDDGCIPCYQHPVDDPRWPRNCEGCGRAFTQNPADRDVPWQVFTDWLYRNMVTGETIANREMPVGAMWYQDFGHGPHSIHLLRRHGLPTEEAGKKIGEINGVRPPHLFLRTPGGVWDMDTIAQNGDGWELTGTPPAITASPSILHRAAAANGWHGWLRDGLLTEC